MSEHNYLEVENLHVEFAGRRTLFSKPRPPVKAVNGVSFSIAPGKTFGLVGESGSGKSTIARALLRLVSNKSGSIRVDGDEVTTFDTAREKKYRAQVQVVFQDPYSSLNPSHVVGEIVGELITQHQGIKSGPERNQLVGDLLEKVGLGRHFLERFPYELSGGQRQRVAIARALSVNPQMIICDEATSALDVSIQSQVINLLEEIQDSTGVSYLFIAHDLAVVRHISHDVGVLYLGYMVESGPAERVYENSAHPYTAMLHAAEPIPDPERQKKRTEVRRLYHIDAEPPSPANLPPGCPFTNRCALVMDICHQAMPDPTPIEGGGLARCHLHTSGPALNGKSVVPLLLESATPIKAKSNGGGHYA
ncbi:MAG: oligopeptide/dipeptide ABC transporter ATP-binding protein [Chloroflexota bacterium]